MDKEIMKEMGETLDLVKNGRPCIGDACYLGRKKLCGREIVGKNGAVRTKKQVNCEWDLRDMDFSRPKSDEDELHEYRLKKMEEKRKKEEKRQREREERERVRKEYVCQRNKINRLLKKKAAQS